MGPLAGVKIVEMAGVGPAPFAGMLLADMGADVVRIDRKPSGEGDAFDAIAERRLLDRGRRSIALDLKKPEAVAAALELVAGADALIEGFPPWRDGAPRPRPGGLPRPQSPPRLRPRHRLGPGGAAGRDRRPRHRLHRPDRRAARDRRQGCAGPAAQPARRLRRRRDVSRLRRRLRASRGARLRGADRSSTRR